MSFSGTPTVVWRRTGEICLVAPEFCLLTEWQMEDLTGGKKYIYEVWALSASRVEVLTSDPTSYLRTSLWSSIGKISPPMHSRTPHNLCIHIVYC